MNHARLFGPVFEILEKCTPMAVVTQGIVQNSFQDITEPSEEINVVLKRNSRLRRLFRDRQLVMKNLVQLNTNLKKIPVVMAQAVLMLICENIDPDFFNFPYFRYPISNMNQRGFLKLLMFASVFLGLLPSLILLAMYPLNYVSHSRDVIRWVLVDELANRFIKELCFRWVALCTIMIGVIFIDFMYAHAQPFFLSLYAIWDLYTTLRRRNMDLALSFKCIVNFALVAMFWNVHWIYDLCLALGDVFHSITFGMNSNVLYGPEKSQKLFSFALLFTFVIPDSYYIHKLSPPDDVETSQIQGYVMMLLGMMFSFVESQVMIYVTLHYGLFPALVLCMAISVISVFSQGAVRNFVQVAGISREVLKLSESSSQDEGGDI
jgi:hypothetical protein